jgi:uncharacterized membrane protein
MTQHPNYLQSAPDPDEESPEAQPVPEAEPVDQGVADAPELSPDVSPEPSPYAEYESAGTPMTDPQPGSYPPPAAPGEKKGGNRTLIIVLVVIGVILILCCCAVFVLPTIFGDSIQDIFDEIIRDLETGALFYLIV